MRRGFSATLFVMIVLATPAFAQGPVQAVAPETLPDDPEAATRAYLDSVPDSKRQRSDAYFEDGYWLRLWGFLYGIGVAWLLLAGGWSARMRDWGEKVTSTLQSSPLGFAGSQTPNPVTYQV